MKSKAAAFLVALTIISIFTLNVLSFSNSPRPGPTSHTANRFCKSVDGLCMQKSFAFAQRQTSFIPNMCATATGDDDIEEKLLDNQIIFSLSTLGDEAFNFSSERMLTSESLQSWESHVDSLASQLNQLTNNAILLAVYGSILRKAAIKELDPLQMATFQLFSNSIMDALVKLHPPMDAITSLIDEITDVHLNFVDKFQPMIDDGGDDGYMKFEICLSPNASCLSKIAKNSFLKFSSLSQILTISSSRISCVSACWTRKEDIFSR